MCVCVCVHVCVHVTNVPTLSIHVVLIQALKISQTECLQKGRKATREMDTGVVLAKGKNSQ